MSWKGILRRAGVNLTGPDGSNDWSFEGIVNARNIVSRFAGSHFHVDSNHANASDGSGYGKRKDKPFATIDYAVGQCAANNADVIWVHAGHVEVVIEAAGLDLDIEGITIVFLGNGDDQAKITFGTDVAADMDVDADNITLINPRFESALDALTGPIDVNKANFTIYNGEYYDAAAKAATDCIVATVAATGLTIDGWRFVVSTTGTQKQSNIQLDGVDNAILRNIDIRGDFGTGNIEVGTDEILNVRMEDIYLDNLNSGPQPCMVLDENCDGFAQNVNCRIASGTTYLSDDSDINWGPNCRGYAADGGSGESLGTSPAGDIEAKIDAVTAQTLKLDGVTIATAPVAASLASFVASGGTALGTQLPASFSLLDMMMGKKVSRTAADVFDGTQTPLFTISGGRVCIKCLMGEVSVAAIDAGASNTSFVTNPTVGTDAAMCTVLDINADENGTIYAVTGNPSVALQGGSGGGASCMDRCFIVPEGTIDLLSVADVGTGGALGAFDIWYVPIDTGATIVAA